VSGVVGLVAAVIGAGGAIGAVILFALRALAATQAAADAQVQLAKTNADLSITRATLETTERLRLAEKERSHALEDELAALDRDVSGSGPGSARDRVLARWRAASAIAAADAGHQAGAVPERPAPAAARP
jgi:hypothetical protein